MKIGKLAEIRVTAKLRERMSEFAILVPKFGDEPPQRKRKLEFPGLTSFHNDSWEDDDYIDPAIEKEYERQVLQSDVKSLLQFENFIAFFIFSI